MTIKSLQGPQAVRLGVGLSTVCRGGAQSGSRCPHLHPSGASQAGDLLQGLRVLGSSAGQARPRAQLLHFLCRKSQDLAIRPGPEVCAFVKPLNNRVVAWR